MISFVIPLAFYVSAAHATNNCFNMGKIDKPFSNAEVNTMRNLFLKNINIDGKGGVVAAPDLNTPGGSYYYHWMRDGALTMRSVQETSKSFDDYEGYLKSYVSWVTHVQSESDPNGIDIRTEPKFNLPNGDVFTEPWCRPQNDGPGLRATALMMFADTLIANNQTAYVQENLWTGSASDGKHGGAIKYDLDYVVDSFGTATCDLWEEYTSDDLFWNKYTMRKAMLMGEKFATEMGDSTSANAYKATAEQIESTLYNNHWTGDAVIEHTGRTYDGAVIVGFNSGFNGDDLFYPTSMEVASTVRAYNSMFCDEYSINSADTSAGVPGILYGRYAGDTYAGGNPWILTTAALGNLFYRGGNYIKEHGAPDTDALNIWSEIFGVPADNINADTFIAAGDSVMNRIRYHVEGKNFHLDEQLDRNTGVEMSAEDLTWSYAEVLNAMASRDKY